MTILQAIVLGIIQGITEFLPISSSGHLILIPYFFNWDLQDLSFDVALHFGTALAILTYFFKDWWEMCQSIMRDIKKVKKGWGDLAEPTRLFVTIISVSIPVGIAGIVLENVVAISVRSPIVVAIMLFGVGLIMLWADKQIKSYPKEKPNFFDALLISLSQIIALIPGTSRAGITISMGLFRGLSREWAAKFSFLLATPLIIGAAIMVFVTSNPGPISASVFLSGLVTSYITGILAIRFLLGFLTKRSLSFFVLYRWFVAILVLVTIMLK